MKTGRTEPVGIEIREPRRKGESRRCAEVMASSEPWITLRRSYKDCLKIVTDPSREVHVATLDGEIVGFVILIMHGALVGFIQTIAVMSEWRGRGIGTRLLSFAEGRIFRDMPNVFMCVSSFNRKAHRLYARRGYSIIGELKDLIVAGHSEILLRKTIGPMTEFRPEAPRQ
jgi:ribosomal-protein-alanine N-acetyltransferase